MNNFLPYKLTRTAFYVAVFWCVIWVGVYGYGLYKVHDMRFAEVEVVDESLEMQRDRLDRFNKEAVVIDGDISQRFAKVGSDVDIIEVVESFGKDKLRSFEISNAETLPVDGKLLNTLKLSIRGQGSWRQIVSYLETLPSQKYVHTIDKYDLRRDTAVGTSSESLWSIDLIMRVPLLSQ